MNERFPYGFALLLGVWGSRSGWKLIFGSTVILLSFQDKQRKQLLFDVKFNINIA